MLNVVLTGEVHIGKTTVCQRVAAMARERRCCVCGILTPPILDENGERLGIEAVDLASGERRELARLCRSNGNRQQDWNWDGPHIGPYHFDPAALRWAQDAMLRGMAVCSDLLMVDEIGHLELEQGQGFGQVLELLETSAALRRLLVVRSSLLAAFLRRLPELEFAAFEVTAENRTHLPAELAAYLFAPDVQLRLDC